MCPSCSLFSSSLYCQSSRPQRTVECRPQRTLRTTKGTTKSREPQRALRNNYIKTLSVLCVIFVFVVSPYCRSSGATKNRGVQATKNTKNHKGHYEIQEPQRAPRNNYINAFVFFVSSSCSSCPFTARVQGHKEQWSAGHKEH